MAPNHDSYAILHAIRRILRSVAEQSRRLSKEAGLTVPQLLCIKALGEFEGHATVVQVGEAVQMSPSTVSRVLDRLEDRGWVRRERGVDDRRKVFLHLTDAGDEVFRSLPSPLQDTFVERLEALSDDERVHIHQVLEQVVDLLDARDVDPSPLLPVDVGSG
mgnify:CR=1 FL=1